MSLFSGLRSKRPFIEEAFFPVSAEKYITISTENHQSKQWDSFQEYINLIYPILKKQNISIIEIGSNEVQFQNITVLKKVTNENHWSFIVKNSLLHIGPENFISSLASYHGVPSITLFSNTNPEYAAPNWIKSDAEQIFISPSIENYKPSFSSQEASKTINKIYTESVIAKTLDILDIKHDYDKYDVFYSGHLYYNKLIEIVPDFTPSNDFLPNSLINIRLDYHFNTASLKIFANKRKLAVVSDREIPYDVLAQIKPNLQGLYFKVDQSDNPDYYLDLKQKGFNVNLIFKKDADLPETKFLFFDWEIHEDKDKDKKSIDNHSKICDTTRYKSSKIIFSKNGQFSSKAAYDKNITSHEDQMIINEQDFWNESDYFKLYNLK